MAHQIEKFDLTYSTSGAEWHGLAVVRTPEEMAAAVRTLFFPLLQTEAIFRVNGEDIPAMDEEGNGWKAILADCRELPKVEGRDTHPPHYVPLHTPKQDYHPIPNERVWEMISNAFDKAGVKFSLATCGTLGNLSRFYLSIAVDGLEIKCPRGFSIQSYLTALTAHNGMHNLQVIDSHIKPVCANTLDAAMRRSGDLNFQVKHTKGAEDAIVNVEEVLADFMDGAADLNTALASLDGREETATSMEEITAGYFTLPAIEAGKRVEDLSGMSGQARKATSEIARLAYSGKGNSGKTRYDLLNGATDYWSNGDGVGSEKVSMRKRVYRSRFGSAANHKRDFFHYLRDDERVVKGRAVGSKILAIHDSK